jgi:hypothetical protein
MKNGLHKSLFMALDYWQRAINHHYRQTDRSSFSQYVTVHAAGLGYSPTQQ